MSGLTYLITGAARGIGKGLLATFLLRPNTTVIAAVRNTITAQESLSFLPVGPGSKLIIIKIDSTIDSDPAAAVSELKTKYSITNLDVLVSNAGFLDVSAPGLGASADQARKHFETNTIGPMVLLQAFMPLLAASPSPKFLVISSTIGSIDRIFSLPNPFFAYGMSKAAVNYLVRKAAFENPQLVSMAFCPGWVRTEMGNMGAVSVGLAEAPVALEDSIKGLVKLFDEASLEKSGMFTNMVGEAVSW